MTEKIRKAYRRREERRPRRRNVKDTSHSGGLLTRSLSDVPASELDLKVFPSAVLSAYWSMRESWKDE
jgi:hypothetical protein